MAMDLVKLGGGGAVKKNHPVEASAWAGISRALIRPDNTLDNTVLQSPPGLQPRCLHGWVGVGVGVGVTRVMVVVGASQGQPQHTFPVLWVWQLVPLLLSGGLLEEGGVCPGGRGVLQHQVQEVVGGGWWVVVVAQYCTDRR